MTKTISFHTFGCRLNQSETASISNSFVHEGYRVVDVKDGADIVVINTCTVTQGGDADTRRMVLKVNRLNPHVRIALVGCQAQIQKEQLAALPNVSWIVGNERKMDLVNVFAQNPLPESPVVITPTINRVPFTLPVPAIDRQHKRASLKIQDGCDFFCTFCEIPYARGRARSRVFDDVLSEANALVNAGHQELILTGINVGTYQHESRNIEDVVIALENIAGLKRIRISSIEPTTIPMSLVDRMNHGKLCRYLHIPIQSAHNEILTAMERKYTLEDFSDFITQAHTNVNNICIGTDVIVGFPGESDQHFDLTVDYLRESPIDYFHVFSYSPRQMAKSRFMDSLPASTIAHRSHVLRELSERKRRMFYESQLGLTMPVIFESYNDGYWDGVTDNFARVRVKMQGDYMNTMLNVRLQSCEAQAIIGELV